MEELRINYLVQYPKQYCLILDNDPPTPDMIEGVDFVLNQIICERVKWGPEEIQLVLKQIKKITNEDLNELTKLISELYSCNISYLKQLTGIIFYSTDESLLLLSFEGELEIYFQDSINSKISLMINHFLISKGYATPYLKLSVIDLISKGWLRLIP